MSIVSFVILALTAGGLLSATAAEELRAEARLIAAARTIRPGTPFTVGVHIRMPEGAHIYWANPGDAGLPTRIAWTLPPGFTAGPIQWPVPAVFADPPLASYGYAGEVVLPVVITPPADLQGLAAVRLAARVDWLLCKETCVPGGADVALGFRVADEPGPRGPDAELLERFAARVPAASPEWVFRFEEDERSIRLFAQPPAELDAAALKRFVFLCSEEDLVEPSAPQAWSETAEGRVFALTLRKTARRRAAGERLSGVLREGPGHPAPAREIFVGVSAARSPPTP